MRRRPRLGRVGEEDSAIAFGHGDRLPLEPTDRARDGRAHGIGGTGVLDGDGVLDREQHNERTGDGTFSLEEVECMGACGGAPMVAINEDYHENITIESLEETGWARLNMPAPDAYAPHAEGGFPTPSGRCELKASMAEGGDFVVPVFREGYEELQSGAEVAIFVTYPLLQTNGTATNIERTRVLLPRVTVLAVGQGRNSTTDTNSGSVLVTVAVNQADAERLISALNAGTLYLGLLSDSVTVTPGAGVDNTDRGGGTPLFS